MLQSDLQFHFILRVCPYTEWVLGVSLQGWQRKPEWDAEMLRLGWAVRIMEPSTGPSLLSYSCGLEIHLSSHHTNHSVGLAIHRGFTVLCADPLLLLHLYVTASCSVDTFFVGSVHVTSLSSLHLWRSCGFVCGSLACCCSLVSVVAFSWCHNLICWPV